MEAARRKCSVPQCNLEVPEGLKNEDRCLDHYIEDAFQKLNQALDSSRNGKGVDHKVLEWLVAQVDCVIETLSGEATTSDPEQHSKLLELLLGIANLNEYVRHQTFVPTLLADGVPKQHVE